MILALLLVRSTSKGSQNHWILIFSFVSEINFVWPAIMCLPVFSQNAIIIKVCCCDYRIDDSSFTVICLIASKQLACRGC